MGSAGRPFRTVAQALSQTPDLERNCFRNDSATPTTRAYPALSRWRAAHPSRAEVTSQPPRSGVNPSDGGLAIGAPEANPPAQGLTGSCLMCGWIEPGAVFAGSWAGRQTGRSTGGVGCAGSAPERESAGAYGVEEVLYLSMCRPSGARGSTRPVPVARWPVAGGRWPVAGGRWRGTGTGGAHLLLPVPGHRNLSPVTAHDVLRPASRLPARWGRLITDRYVDSALARCAWCSLVRVVPAGARGAGWRVVGWLACCSRSVVT
jgi:hypothetical protein